VYQQQSKNYAAFQSGCTKSFGQTPYGQNLWGQFWSRSCKRTECAFGSKEIDSNLKSVIEIVEQCRRDIDFDSYSDLISIHS